MRAMIRKILPLLCISPSLLWAGKNVSTQKGEVLPAIRSSSTPTRMLFPFLTTQSGYDSEITISNTSQDTSGSIPQAGTCTLNFFGSNAPAAGTTISITAGKQVVFNLSQGGAGIAAAPNFLGYVMASCTFPLARG